MSYDPTPSPAQRKIARLDERIAELQRKRDDALRDHSEQLGFKPCMDCMDGFCTMNCSNAPSIIKVSYR